MTPEPLTEAAFAPFGNVIHASDTAVKLDINQGHAVRYDRLAEIDTADQGGTGIVSLFRARPLDELVLRTFERHPLGTQSFVPLSGRPYLVAVAPAGDFEPDKVRLFRAGPDQGVHYAKGVWHHFLLALGGESDFLVVDRAGPGDNLDEVALPPGAEIRVRAHGTTARRAGVNAHLVGIPGSRGRLNTPSLVVDIDLLDANIALMADACRRNGIGLRPHSKTHKSVEIARRQLAAGAVGICCAKLGEGEALAAGGIGSILVTSPIVTAEGGRRLAALNAACPDLIAVTSDPANVALLSEAAAASGKPLQLIVDLDVGQHRTGIAPGKDAVALARSIAAEPKLRFAGIQGYAGHLMHVHDRGQRKAATLTAMDQLAAMKAALESEGIACPIVTGGGSGTFDLDPGAGVLTDLQAGSYVFMDVQYAEVWEAEGQGVPFATSLFVQTTVISANVPGIATTDAGLKTFATDAGPPRILAGAPDGTRYQLRSDEQGRVEFAPGQSLPVGAILTCAVPHCDPTVNLYDHYHVVRGDTLVDIWPVDARGRSQ